MLNLVFLKCFLCYIMYIYWSCDIVICDIILIMFFWYLWNVEKFWENNRMCICKCSDVGWEKLNIDMGMGESV